ncbi:hypothetical protein GMRT_20411 [Giardia muris]|uniref:Uncharacterized protein n=1 Tax=Giardia muris TaxID=5742 RepID=A0A4Z1SUU9_GIAMU|nr:hypothetical protein GMRT_20411 [Giardia muris]|eukprot:TNJ29616.1 hypothetical protein GMRT_20411 [Giardia muris]
MPRRVQVPQAPGIPSRCGAAGSDGRMDDGEDVDTTVIAMGSLLEFGAATAPQGELLRCARSFMGAGRGPSGSMLLFHRRRAMTNLQYQRPPAPPHRGLDSEEQARMLEGACLLCLECEQMVGCNLHCLEATTNHVGRGYIPAVPQ